MKKRIVSVVTVVMMALTVFGYGGAATVSAASGTPISSGTEFVEKITANPNGSYYLAKSITLPANTQITERFKGTLDGNGKTIKSYRYSRSGDYTKAGIFESADNATFKNIKMTGVRINLTNTPGTDTGALVVWANNCTFNNIKVYGSINAGGVPYTASFNVGGIAGLCSYNTKFTNCINDIDIKVTAKNEYSNAYVGGLAGKNDAGSISKCTNKGNITLSGSAGSYAMNVAGLVGGRINTAKSCTNKGNVSLNVNGAGVKAESGAAGICGTVGKSITSSKNTGKITVKCNSRAEKVYAAGILGVMTASKGSMSKCNNKGAITFTGKTGSHYDGAKVAGLAGECSKATQCFNKGAVKATVKSGFARTGGICGTAYAITNNYNTAKIYLKGDGYIGGLAGTADLFSKNSGNYNYNTGKITVSGKAKTKKFYGSVFGDHAGNAYAYTAKYNYYKKGTSSRAYGHSEITNKYKAKATKVSSISKKKCPKLSKKYWKYSSKAKRMVLKNNKE